MKKIYIICTAAAVIASSAHAVTDRTYKTKGDMTEEEISLVMDMREILEDTDVAIFSARNKLSNAILASTIGTVLEASALATGIVKNVQQSKAEIKASAELEKLTDEELSARFKAQFIKDCESDKKKNPNSYKAEKEDGTKEDITCQSLEGNFHKSKEIEANKEAMLSYLTEATASDDKKAQAFNWIRMGASAGGAIAGVVSVSVMSSVQKQLDEVPAKAVKLQKAAGELHNRAMQARLEGRQNNPLMEIASRCNKNDLASKLSDVSKKIKKAKTVQTIGAVASVGSAVTSGVQNINAVGEKKGLNLASDITAGTAAIASGVGIALAASANKTIFDAEKKLFDCMEYLWWDENEHTYAAQLKPEKCSAGQKLVDNKCIDCYQKNNRVGYVDPGVTCKPICEKFYQPRDDGAFDWACVYVGITSSADYVEYCQNKATKESCELLFNGQDVNEKFKDTLNMTNGTTGVVDDLTSAKSKLQSYMDGIAKQYGSAGGAYCKLDSGKYLVYAGYDNKHGSLQRSGPSLSGTMGICFWNGGKCITNTFIDDSGGHWNPEMPSNCISAYGI